MRKVEDLRPWTHQRWMNTDGPTLTLTLSLTLSRPTGEGTVIDYPFLRLNARENMAQIIEENGGKLYRSHPMGEGRGEGI